MSENLMKNAMNAKKKRLEKKREDFVVLKERNWKRKKRENLKIKYWLLVYLRIEKEKRVAEKEKEN